MLKRIAPATGCGGAGRGMQMTVLAARFYEQD